MDDTTGTPPGEPSYTVPTRPDGWPDLLGRRPPSRLLAFPLAQRRDADGLRVLAEGRR